jgi:hypothetical protein
MNARRVATVVDHRPSLAVGQRPGLRRLMADG